MKTTIRLPKFNYTHIDKHGRIVIPAEIRAELGLEPGEKISLLVKDGRLEVANLKRAVREKRGLARRLGNIPEDVSIVDEFIADRHEAAARGE